MLTLSAPHMCLHSLDADIVRPSHAPAGNILPPPRLGRARPRNIHQVDRAREDVENIVAAVGSVVVHVFPDQAGADGGIDRLYL